MDAVSGHPFLKSLITLANFIFSGNIPDWNDSFIIQDRGVDITGERNFNIFVGMLLGPRDFPDFRSEIISDTSRGTEGAVKKEFPTLSAMKSKVDLLDLGILLVMWWETLTKYLLKMLAITAGSDVMFPFESLSLLITFILLDFQISMTDLIPDHDCFMLLLFLWK